MQQKHAAADYQAAAGNHAAGLNTTPRTLSRQERRTGFGEVEFTLTLAQAVQEANRCLYCYDAPCIQGCPARIQIPEFIARIRSRNLTGAAEVIYRDNPLGAICGRVCPVEALCQKGCTSCRISKPIAIGSLQRFVCDLALQEGRIAYQDEATTRGKVAVVGSGPAGLSCAHYLRQLGFNVDLFEREELAGGLLRWGIPIYRLPEEVAKREIDIITNRVALHRKYLLAAQAEDFIKQYDAIFLGVGLSSPVLLRTSGADLPGVYAASSFLRTLREGKSGDFAFRGKEIAVVGGGATALDAARSAIRLEAAKVTVLYRRTIEEMPAFSSEVEAAFQEGVDFLWLTSPVEITQVDGRLKLTLEGICLGEPDESGRASVIPTGVRTNFLADVVLVAIASQAEPASVEGWKDHPKVFRGGDLTGGATVVQAVADGKEAALRIISWLEKGGSR
ncbi:MAG: FAD-dependent oxidoreductase [Coprothermobacterota bacterium]|nr:FAD-dependent oxidoreductase [Coprothermobacterota bacterium]